KAKIKKKYFLVALSRSLVTIYIYIYILETLPVEEKKRRLFHEIIEADLQRQGFGNDAHNITLKTEIEVFGERKTN
ncbi:MAG: hypothetical protein Q8L47_05245, partial [bacterium]|nr:hypothetical protein [bacterium]